MNRKARIVNLTGGEQSMHTLRKIALAFAIIGAINWGLIGFFQFDLVASIFGGQGAALSRIIYGIVGISGLICLSYYYNPEAERTIDDKRGMRANQPGFGTEFSEDFDTDSRMNHNERSPRDE